MHLSGPKGRAWRNALNGREMGCGDAGVTIWPAITKRRYAHTTTSREAT